MRTETMPLKISLTVAALPWLLLGCGDLTDGGPSSSPGSIGKLMLVANAPAVAGEPLVTTKRVVSATGTGTIGPVTVTYYDLDHTPCDSPLPEVAIKCPTAPDAVTIGPDGAPWYATGGYMVRVGEDDTAVKVPKPEGVGFLGSLASGGGAVWGTSWIPTPGVLRFDPVTGASAFYALPAQLSRPAAAAMDAHGDLLVVGGERAVVGRIDAHRNVYVVAQEGGPAPITSVGSGLAVGAAGAVYISDYSAGRLGRVEGSGFVWTDLGGDTQAPSGMAAAADGAIWFVDLGKPSQVGRIDAAGALQTFPLPAELQQTLSDKSGSSIAVAPDGAAWFTVPERDAVVRVTAAGELSYVSLESQSLPRGLAIDAHGAVWVTTMGFTRIDLGS